MQVAFNKLPKIDSASKQSEQSENTFERLFSRKSGFICRKDTPDFGCDYDVELVIDNSNASGWRFAVQLKSVAKSTTVEGGKFISYKFRTSRLGYLINRIPAMGLITIYDESSGTLYFEYVDEIYQRLIEEKGNEQWKDQDEVNIRIPVENIVNDSSLQKIHKTFINRFRAAETMQLSNGCKYNLPSINVSGESKYDLNNIHHIQKIIKEIGISLLNQQELGLVFNLISKIPHNEIRNDKELLVVAAITFCEVGRHIDSKAFVSKLLKIKELDNSTLSMVSFTRLKNQLALGEIDNQKFIEELTCLNKDIIGGENEICIKINLDFFRLLSLKSFHDIPSSLEESNQIIFASIESLKCSSEKKMLFEIWNADNYALIVGKYRQSTLAEFRIRESLGELVSLEERKTWVETITKLTSNFYSRVHKLEKSAKDSNNNLLLAYLINLYVRYHLSLEIDFCYYGEESILISKNDKHLINEINLSINAINIFLELNHFKEAFQSLCNTLELIEFAKGMYNYQDLPSEEDLIKLKNSMELELDIQPYDLVAPKILTRIKTPDESGNGLPFVRDMDDAEIERIANIFLKSRRMPSEYLKNIINELKAYRIFHNRCNDENLLIFEVYDKVVKKEEHFKYPVKFVLVNKKSGVETPTGTDIEKLLQYLGI